MSDLATEVLTHLFDVRGTRVVVTGAAGGLGFAMAEVLADCGARVTLADVDKARLDDARRASSPSAGAMPAPSCATSRTRIRFRRSSTMSSRRRVGSTWLRECRPRGGAGVPRGRWPDARHRGTLRLGPCAQRQPDRRHAHDAERRPRDEASGIRTHHRHRVERGPAPRAACLLRLRGEQGGRHPHGPTRGARAGAPRDPRQRHLSGAVLRAH